MFIYIPTRFLEMLTDTSCCNPDACCQNVPSESINCTKTSFNETDKAVTVKAGQPKKRINRRVLQQTPAEILEDPLINDAISVSIAALPLIKCIVYNVYIYSLTDV